MLKKILLIIFFIFLASIAYSAMTPKIATLIAVSPQVSVYKVIDDGNTIYFTDKGGITVTSNK